MRYRAELFTTVFIPFAEKTTTLILALNRFFRRKNVSENKINSGSVRKNLFIVIFLSALIVLTVLSAVWACTYTVNSVVELSGISDGNAIVCYVDAKTAANLSEGMSVIIDGNESGIVSFIADKPLSKTEVYSTLPGEYIDFTAATLNVSEWNYKIVITLERPVDADLLVSLSIVTRSARPIDYLF